MLVELDLFAVLRMILSVLFFFRGIAEDQVSFNSGFYCVCNC